ncbi:MAG: TRAP transporter substrate-binding protein [Pseudomonadota bacterium]
MNTESLERRYSPLIILLLIASLVVVVGLWASSEAGNDTTAVTGTATDSKVYEWKLVTTWPKNFPGLGSAAQNFSNYVNDMSGGRLKVRVYGAGEIVPAFEVFDAVSQGVADAGHGAAYYWKGKIPSSVFFTAIPFGMTAQEMNGWFHHGGGLELWREAYAPFNVLPFVGGSTGVQMAGWFNREINSVSDLTGLKMRIPGLAGEVFAETGGTAVRISGSELYTSLQTGVIDATEWVGPYNDLALGLHQAAGYYYFPGWHEPGAMLELIINQGSFDALPEDLQAIVTYAARAASQDMLDEFTARNNAALQELITEHGAQLRRLPDDVLIALYESTQIVLEDLVAGDPMAAKVYESYQQFYDSVRQYHQISEQAFINARDEVIDKPVRQSPDSG